MNNENNELMPELQDIINRVYAYNATHPQGQFIVSFVGWEKDLDNICEDCGDHCDKISDKYTWTGVHGDLYTLREIVNCLQDMIEDEVDDEGFVSF